jgi:hypothetical protein
VKIGVFGDSFADRYIAPTLTKRGYVDESWMQYLENLGHRVECYGLSSTSTWYSFQKFLILHEYMDAIVFVYSHHGRIHSMPEPYALFSSFVDRPIEQLTEHCTYQNCSSEDQENIMTIVKGANLTSNSIFNLFVQHRIFAEVNKICREKNIKLVNILPFEDKDSIKDFELKSAHGDCLYNLIPVVYKEMDVSGSDSRQCHLSLENNTILGKVIVESLNSNSPANINLNKEVSFIFSEEITNRYIARYQLLEKNEWK